jgi:hypothetical protein
MHHLYLTIMSSTHLHVVVFVICMLSMTKLYLRGTNEVKVIQNKVRIRIIKIEMYYIICIYR